MAKVLVEYVYVRCQGHPNHWQLMGTWVWDEEKRVFKRVYGTGKDEISEEEAEKLLRTGDFQISTKFPDYYGISEIRHHPLGGEWHWDDGHAIIHENGRVTFKWEDCYECERYDREYREVMGESEEDQESES